MALIGSLESGVSAMQSFVRGMEVIGDNIANSKTIAFKRQRVNYSSNFPDTLRDASPGGENGGNLPAVQIGSGVKLGGSESVFSQGSIARTGVNSHLGISGDGFFRVLDLGSGVQYLTRDGTFRVNGDGFITDKNGNYLLGLTGGEPGVDPSNIGRIKLDLAQSVKVNDSGEPLDSFGRIVLDDGTRVESGTGTDYRVDENGRLLDNPPGDPASLVLRDIAGSPARAVFNPGSGQYELQDGAGNLIDEGGAPSASAVEWDPNEVALAQPGDPEATAAEWDSSAPVPPVATVDENDPNQFRLAIQTWTINRSGDLVLSLNDGSSYTRSRVLLQNVKDPPSLVNEGDGLFTGFQNAGAQGLVVWNLGTSLSPSEIADHAPNENGLGYLQSRSLETSNTDLTAEFADMITTQRAFQAGSRIITVSDEILQEIINLKR